MRWPRPLDELDRQVGADPDAPLGALACFEPRLPNRADSDEATWSAMRQRFDERWREHRGPIGDRVRALELAGILVVDRRTGVLLDPTTGHPVAAADMP